MEKIKNGNLESCFSIKDFSFFYPEQEIATLKNVSLDVYAGEFLVLCGPSGCGKSTLLRQLKTVLAPHGHCLGNITFEGVALENLDHREQSQRIGFVQQSPENQVVTDKVWHELAFGMESLGYDTPTIRRRVAEMASFFGIQNWFYKNVTELSGGQKQLLNLASVMAMQPSVLILDEPTAQLDPIAASEFLGTLGKINRELGTTIILTEHRLEDAFPLANRVAVMVKGELICVDTPYKVGRHLSDIGHGMFLALPTPMRIWAAVKNNEYCPITVSEGRTWLSDLVSKQQLLPVPPKVVPACGDVMIKAEDCWFRYEQDLPDVVKGMSIEVRKCEFVALLGGNGTGKTTSLKLLANLQKAYRGRVEAYGTLGVLPQNPQTLFVKKTVREDLFEILKDKKFSREFEEKKVAYVMQLCQLEGLLERHPYDLSGGEQQRVALAKVLLLDPEILLMDEPTKGLDAEFKEIFAQIMEVLVLQGKAILMVSHDIEFCAKYAHRCALFFDGNIVTQAAPTEFFGGNSFYTTATNRMSRGICNDAVVADDLVAACGGQVAYKKPLKVEDIPLPPEPESETDTNFKKMPLWRKLIAFVSAAISIGIFVQILNVTDLTTLIGQEGMTDLGAASLDMYGYLIASLVVFTLAISRKSAPPIVPVQIPKIERKLSKRTIAAAIMILMLVPFTLFVGVFYLQGMKYYFIALLILLECMAPFFLIFEGRKPQARELVVIAVLCGIAVAGRAAFFMLPQFKPVMALCIISGVAFGGETGFLVGAMTMIASNIFFGQGPWTPWQMFAMGVIGFLAGILFKKGFLRRTKVSLGTFGLFAAIVIYGGIMNPTGALLWSTDFNPAMLMTYYISGLPMDIIQGIATFIFLWYGAEPMLEKLDRIKEKYGLM